MIEAAMRRVAWTTMGPTAPGRTWRRMIRV
jgi:hypothetical protein